LLGSLSREYCQGVIVQGNIVRGYCLRDMTWAIVMIPWEGEGMRPREGREREVEGGKRIFEAHIIP